MIERGRGREGARCGGRGVGDNEKGKFIWKYKVTTLVSVYTYFHSNITPLKSKQIKYLLVSIKIEEKFNRSIHIYILYVNILFLLSTY